MLCARASLDECIVGMSGGQPQLQPSFSVHMEMGRGAATWSGDGISFKQEIPVTRRVGFEVISYNTQLHAVTVCSVVF